MTQPPMLQSNLDNVSPKQALMGMWFIWAALLLGPLMFMGVVAYLLSQNHQPAAPSQPLLVIVNLAMLLTMVPVTFFIRRTIQQRSRRPDGTVPAGPYSTGNIIFWAGCESVSFFGLVVALVNRSFWPTILVVAVAMALQAVSRPKLAALEAPENPYETR